MTQDQKTLERFEFRCEDGVAALIHMYNSRQGSASSEEKEALVAAECALRGAQQALSHAYDVLGATAKARRRQGC